MKARNREINIFNMSLLDVLCGALGAFCFMMLVLFPYYKPQEEKKNTPPPEPPQNCEECMKQHEDMRKQVEELKQRNSDLEMRNPFLIEMFPRFTGYDIDIYINDDRTGAGGTKTPPPDMTKAQDKVWTGDRYLGGTGAYPEVWLVRDAPKGNYRIYYKVMKFIADPTTLPTIVEGRFLSGTDALYLPKVIVRKVGELIHVATVSSDGAGTFTLKPEIESADFDKFAKERDDQINRENEERRRQQEQKQLEQKRLDDQKKQ